MSQWFDQSANANKLRQSYLKGFLDISGGGIYLRSDNSMNFYSGTTSTRPTLSIGGTKMTVYRTTENADSLNDDEVSINSLRFLKGLHTNLQDYMDAQSGSSGSLNTGNIVSKNQTIDGNLSIGNTLVVGGNAYFRSNVGIDGNLTVGGDAHILGDEYIDKSLIVGGNATIDGSLTVKGDVSMGDYHFGGYTISALHDLSVNGHIFGGMDASLNANLFVGKNMLVAQDASFSQNVEITGHLKVASLSIGTSDTADDSTITFGQKFNVTSDVSFGDALTVAGIVDMKETLNVTGATKLASTLEVIGATDLKNTLAVAEGATFDKTLTVTGAVNMNGGVSMSPTSNLTVGGTTTLNKLASLTAGLEVTGGNAAITNNLTVGGNATVTGKSAVTGRFDVTADASLNSSLSVANQIFANRMIANTSLRVGSNMKIYDHVNGSTAFDATNGNIYLNPGVGSETNKGIVHIANGLIVDGSINFTGEWIRTDTNVQFTTQVDVVNDGTGPALKCEQKGTNDVAVFIDDNSTVMRVLNGRKVAINKDTAAYSLDVSGTIHADSNIRVDGSAYVVGNYSSAAGNIILTNGKMITKTFEATSTSMFDATITLTGGNLDMTAHADDNSSQGFLVQF